MSCLYRQNSFKFNHIPVSRYSHKVGSTNSWVLLQNLKESDDYGCSFVAKFSNNCRLSFSNRNFQNYVLQNSANSAPGTLLPNFFSSYINEPLSSPTTSSLSFAIPSSHVLYLAFVVSYNLCITGANFEDHFPKFHTMLRENVNHWISIWTVEYKNASLNWNENRSIHMWTVVYYN